MNAVTSEAKSKWKPNAQQLAIIEEFAALIENLAAKNPDKSPNLSDFCRRYLTFGAVKLGKILAVLDDRKPESYFDMVSDQESIVDEVQGLIQEINTDAARTELAGVEAGATCIHSCANGLGERTGNAALEELIVALHVLYGYGKQYKLDKLPELGEIAARVSGLPIAANKPILGSRNFTRESGIGVDLVVREPLAMFGTHPALTGRAGEVVLGKKSGKASITYTLEKLGIAEPEDAAIGEMLKQVKDLGIQKRGLVTDDEFRSIAVSVIGASAKA